MSVEARLAALRERFRARMVEDLDVIETWALACRTLNPDIVARIHNLAGGAGVFGFAQVHSAAALADDEAAAGAIRAETVERLIETLRQAVAA